MPQRHKNCKHKRRQDNCAICRPCPHGQRKGMCGKCCPCLHGKREDNCAVCSPFRNAQFAGYRIILTRTKLPKNYEIRRLIAEPRLTDALLQNLAHGGGYPDWRGEALEEKKAGDSLKANQWARAILTMRHGGRYRVAWRFSSTKRKVFDSVFDFYDWVRRQ